VISLHKRGSLLMAVYHSEETRRNVTMSVGSRKRITRWKISSGRGGRGKCELAEVEVVDDDAGEVEPDDAGPVAPFGKD
jgi:hypothetical protein